MERSEAAIGLDQPKDLLSAFRSVRERSLSLCEGLCPDDFLIQSTEDTSPPKWHLAHTTWFFDRFVLREIEPEIQFHPDIDFLFNSYYRGIGSFREKKHRNWIARPSLEDIFKYREWLESNLNSKFPSDPDSKLLFNLRLGIQHEQQHQELLLMDIKQNFSVQASPPTYSLQTQLELSHTKTNDLEPAQWMEFSSAEVRIGSETSDTNFCFDNESPAYHVQLRGFQLSSKLVSNAEFLEFIQDAGYERPELWLSDGWDWLQVNKVKAPLYWQRDGDSFLEFSLGGLNQLTENSPVCHISFYEADAFARWKKCRLPNEFELEHAFQQFKPQRTGGFLETGLFHPRFANQDLQGQVWQWTSSPYQAYPGHQSFLGHFAEYNSKFMCNQFVLRGGSFATPFDHYRSSYRNFYYPHQRWQFSGLRLAKDAE